MKKIVDLFGIKQFGIDVEIGDSCAKIQKLAWFESKNIQTKLWKWNNNPYRVQNTNLKLSRYFPMKGRHMNLKDILHHRGWECDLDGGSSLIKSSNEDLGHVITVASL